MWKMGQQRKNAEQESPVKHETRDDPNENSTKVFSARSPVCKHPAKASTHY